MLGVNSMLEKIATHVLNRYLGEYVEGFENRQNINMSLGSLELRNLQLKKSALDSLELPIVVKEGFLGYLSLKIPWKNLSGEAAIIKIEDIYILLGPSSKTAQSAQGAAEKELSAKLSRLALAEILGLDQPDDDTSQKKVDQKESGWMSSLTMKVTDNLQFYIDRVHIRYEDDTSIPGRPFAVGLTLDHIFVQSTDAKWNPFLSVGEAIKHKLVTLKNCAIYFNTGEHHSKPLVYTDMADLGNQLRVLIYQEHQKETKNSYLLEPVSGKLMAEIDSEKFRFERPRLTLNFQVDSITMSLKRDQYLSAMSIMDGFALYDKNLKYLKYRPPTEKSAVEDPLAWWKYAIEAKRADARETCKRWTWENIRSRAMKRQGYIELFKRIKDNRFDSIDTDQLEIFEKELPYEDIIIYRRLAYASLKRDKHIAAAAKKNQGWVSWAWGSPLEKEEEDQTVVWKEIYSVIDYSPDAMIAETKFPREFVKTQLQISVSSGSFKVTNEHDILILNAAIIGIGAGIQLREGSTDTKFEVESFEIREYLTLAGNPFTMLTPSVDSCERKFLSLQCDMNPIDSAKPLDVRLQVKMKPLILTYVPRAFKSIGDVFKVPDSKAMVELADAASKGIDELRAAASNRIKFALEQELKLEIHIDIDAPTIVFPQNFITDAPALVIDLGNIEVQHDSTQRESHIVEKPDKKYNRDTTVTVEYFYDLYSLKLTGMHAYMARSHNLRKEIMGTLVHPFDINCDLKLLKVKSTELPTFEITGRLPNLSLAIGSDLARELFAVAKAMKVEKDTAKQLSEASFRILDPVKLPPKPQKITKKKNKILDLKFSVGILKLELLGRSLGMSSELQTEQVPCFAIQFEGLTAQLFHTNYSTALQMELQRLLIRDQSHMPTLFESHVEPERLNSFLVETPPNQTIISLDIAYIPTISPEYKNLDTEIKGSFGELNLNFDRVIIASLLQWLNNFHKSIQTAKPPDSPETGVAVQTTQKLAKSGLNHEVITLRVNFTMVSLSTSLFRNNAIFLQQRFSGTKISVDLKEDDSMDLSVELKGATICDFNHTKWKEIISTRDDEAAVKIRYSTFPPNSEHDASLKLEVGSVKWVYTSRFMNELRGYFSVFSKIKQQVAIAANQVALKTAEIVKEHSTHRLILDIDISNPIIIVPQSSDSESCYLSLDLGNILIKNSFEEQSGNIVMDTLNINFQQLNVLTYQDSFKSTFFAKTDLMLSVIRPLSKNEDLLVPHSDILVHVDTIKLDFQEKILGLFVGILSNNFSEEVPVADINEETTVQTTFGNIDTSIWETKIDQVESESSSESEVQGIDGRVTLHLNVLLKEASLLVSPSVGDRHEPLFSCQINHFEFDLKETDQHESKNHVILGSITIKDERRFHQNCYVEFLSPYLKNEQANQFELQYNTSRVVTEVICSMASPKIYLVGDLSLQIVQFCSKLAQLSTSTETSDEAQDSAVVQTTPTEQPKKEKQQESLFKIDLDVQAPSVLIPANTHSKEGAILVIDLGRITVKHDGNQPGAHLDISEVPETVKGARQFDIKMDSLSVSLVDAQDAESRRKIIKDFEINLQIFMKGLDIYVFGGLPGLEFCCSPDLVDETLFIMLQVGNFIKRASVALSEDPNKYVTPALPPARILIWPEHAVEHGPKVSHSQGSSKKPDVQQDATNIYVLFKIDSLSLNLEDDTKKTLSTLLFNKFLLKTRIKEQTTSVELSLGDFDVQTFVPFITGFHGAKFDHEKGVIEVLMAVKNAAKKHFPASRNQIEQKKTDQVELVPTVERVPHTTEVKFTAGSFKVSLYENKSSEDPNTHLFFMSTLSTLITINEKTTAVLLKVPSLNFDLTSKIVQLIHRLANLKEVPEPGAEQVVPVDDDLPATPMDQSTDQLDASGYHPMVAEKLLKLNVVVECDAVKFRVAETVELDTSLMNVSFERLSFLLEQFSDKSQGCQFKLSEVCVDDMRQHDKNICRRIIQSSGEGDQLRVNFDYDHPSKTTNIKVGFDAPKFFVAPSALLDYADFFISFASPKPKKPVVPSESQEGASESLPLQPVQPTKKDKSKIGFNMEVVSPKIVFVEDTLSPSTNALIIDLGTVFVKLDRQSQQTVVGVELKEISSFRCKLDDISTNSFGTITGMRYLIQPIEIGASVTVDEASPLRVNGQISSIDTEVSYRDLAFSIKISKGFYPFMDLLSSTKQQPDVEPLPAGQSPLSNSQRLTATKSSSDLVPINSNGSSPKPGGVEIELILLKSKITFLNDFKSANSRDPFLELSLEKISTLVTMADQAVEVTAKMDSLGLNLWNEDLEPAKFEPVIEPWSVSSTVRIEKTSTRITINNDDGINFNSSKPLLKTIFSAIILAQKLVQKLEPNYKTPHPTPTRRKSVGDGENGAEKLYNISLKNRTGHPLLFWKNMAELQTCQSGQQQTLATNVGQFDARTFSFRVISPEASIVFDKDVKDIPLTLTTGSAWEISNSDSTLRVVVDIEVTGRNKCFIIRGLSSQHNLDVCALPEDDQTPKKEFHLNLIFSAITLSILDLTPKPVLFLAFQNINLNVGNLPTQQSFSLAIKSVQIDNQDSQCQFPVIFWNVLPRKEDFIDINIIKNTDFKSITFFENFVLCIQPFEIQVESPFIFDILEVISDITGFIHEEIKLISGEEEHPAETPAPAVPAPAPAQQPEKPNMYFKVFEISPIRAKLSARLRGGLHHGAIFEWMLRGLGTLGNVHKAPVSLAKINFPHALVTSSDLGDHILAHYTSSFKDAAILIVGSVDILGNPVSLFSNLRDGVYDFVHEPLSNTSSVLDFGYGLSRGTTSLVQKSTFAIFGSISKFLGSLSKMGSTVLGPDYQTRHTLLQEQKPVNIAEGVQLGISDFSDAVNEGFTGLVHDPKRGFADSGVQGLMIGTGKGFLGFLLKPLIGTLDLATRTAEGISNSALSEASRKRVRPPRYFGPTKQLTPYNLRKAQGQEILYMLGDEAAHQYYIWHFEAARNCYIIVTTDFVIFTGSAPSIERGKVKCDWYLKKSIIQAIRFSGGLTFTLLTKAHEEFQIVTKDGESLEYIWKKLHKHILGQPAGELPQTPVAITQQKPPGILAPFTSRRWNQTFQTIFRLVTTTGVSTFFGLLLWIVFKNKDQNATFWEKVATLSQPMFEWATHRVTDLISSYNNWNFDFLRLEYQPSRS